MQIRVPCSTSNLGSGVDCLGVALNRYLTVIAETADQDEVSFGAGFPSPVSLPDNLFLKAFKAVYDTSNEPRPSVRVHMETEIPLSRGLGSSASAIVAGVIFANRCMGSPYSIDELINMATAIEGHPDNIVPCMVGGFTVAMCDEGKVSYHRAQIGDGLKFIAAVPAFELSTREARAMLPNTVTLTTAVRQIQRAALLTSALLNRRWELISSTIADELFTPARKNSIPGWDTVVTAANAAGARGVILSGAGPTVMALATDREAEISRAMQNAFFEHGMHCETYVLSADPAGTQVGKE